MPKPTLGQVIAKWRNFRRMSQEEFAEKTGLARGTVAQIEISQIKWPRPDTLQTIADVLDIPLEQLFRESGILAPDPNARAEEMADLLSFLPDLAELVELVKDHPDKLPTILRLARATVEQ